MSKKIVVIVLISSVVFSLVRADCYLVYSSKVTSSLGGPGRHGPMSDSKCKNLKVQQASVVGSSNVWCECSSGNTSTSGYSGNNALPGIIGIFMQGLMQGLENQQREAEKRAKEEQWKKEEEERRKKEKEQQQAVFINSQTNALNLLGNRPGSGTSFFGSPPTNTMGSNFEPIGSGKYDAAPMKQIERLMCSTYFAQQALIAVKNHQDEKARYLNHQGDLVMEGKKYQEECKIPPIPQPPEPSLARAPDDTETIKNIETITFAIQKDIKELQIIETKLQDNKKKIEETQIEKEKVETKIKEIQDRPIDTLTSGEKEQQDALLREAMALEEEINAMNKSHDKDVDEKSKIEGSLQEKSRMLQKSQSNTLSSGKKDEKK